MSQKLERRAKIKAAIRRKISGNTERPRLSVFRSNKEIYAQIINDETGTTLVAASSQKVAATGNKTDQAKAVGVALAQAAKAAGVEKVVFDRNGYLYHGRVKALADAAREGGLTF
jgi:large subunit ribosomal protein L18